jgi:hypothetical protein
MIGRYVARPTRGKCGNHLHVNIYTGKASSTITVVISTSALQKYSQELLFTKNDMSCLFKCSTKAPFRLASDRHPAGGPPPLLLCPAAAPSQQLAQRHTQGQVRLDEGMCSGVPLSVARATAEAGRLSHRL